jgi:ribosomal protein L29
MSVFIEGSAFPLGIINANGWGVPFTEADNALATLQSSVVRICSRMGPHDCDYAADPFSEIGKVVEAWREGDDIKVKAEITDSVAAQKIEDGTWKTNWSVFVGFNDVDAGGWVHGIAAESITIVNDPAWPTSSWKIVSASDGSKKGIKIISQFTVKKTASKTEGEITPDETVEELKKKLADTEKELAELKAKAQTPGSTGDAGNAGKGGEGGEGGESGESGEGGEGGDTGGLEKEVANLRASNATLEKQIKENKKLLASYEVEKAKMIPISELETRIAAALEKHDTEIAAKIERDNAFALFAAVRKERLGKDTNPDEYKNLSAADFKNIVEDMGGPKKASASGSGFSYPASSAPKGSTVGRWNSTKKEWV